MVNQIRIGGADLVGTEDLKELASPHEGPCVSIFMGTNRSGPDTQQDPTLLGELLDDANDQLSSMGLEDSEIEAILGPHRALVDDGEFWRYPADGLALYCAPSFHRLYRVQLPLTKAINTGTSFLIRPLLPLLAGDNRFFLLAISQNHVRLYEATRDSIAELKLGPIPGSMDQALEGEEYRREFNFRSVGRAIQYFGSGVGGEVDKQSVERFLRAIDHGVVERLGAEGRHPLVLASVPYYAPLYRAMSRYPNIIEETVEGNADYENPRELHEHVWPLIRPYLDTARQQALTRLREAPTARIATLITDVVASAREGGIDTLLIAPAPPIWGRIDPATEVIEELDGPSQDSEDLLECAAAYTLLNDGKVFQVEAAELQETSAAAILRF